MLYCLVSLHCIALYCGIVFKLPCIVALCSLVSWHCTSLYFGIVCFVLWHSTALFCGVLLPLYLLVLYVLGSDWVADAMEDILTYFWIVFQITVRFHQRKDLLNRGMRVQLPDLFLHLLLKKSQIVLDPYLELPNSSLLQAFFIPVNHVVDQEQKMP